MLTNEPYCKVLPYSLIDTVFEIKSLQRKQWLGKKVNKKKKKGYP